MNTAPNPQALHAALVLEFDRLNQAHFDSELTRPEIVVSLRKTYGGYYQPKQHRIVVSWQAHQEHGWAETLNTFRHEVAHIVHPNHSPEFWALALRLGAAQRYASAPLKPRAAGRYVYECPTCRRRLVRRRRLRLSSCAACDKKFNPAHTLRLVRTQHG